MVCELSASLKSPCLVLCTPVAAALQDGRAETRLPLKVTGVCVCETVCPQGALGMLTEPASIQAWSYAWLDQFTEPHPGLQVMGMGLWRWVCYVAAPGIKVKAEVLYCTE